MSLDAKQITEALVSLRPNAIFTLNGDDFENIIWESVESIPSLEEVEIEYAALLAKQEQDRADKAAAKQALLDRLGITAEEAALLLG